MYAAQHHPLGSGPRAHIGAVGACSRESSLGLRILDSIVRAVVREDPPLYSRGAWSIISDVPYPAPPPYAGSRCHPPSYEEALEIGVVASPLRAQQLRTRRTTMAQQQQMGRTASAPQLGALPESAGRLRAASLGSSSPACSSPLLPVVPEDDDDTLPEYEIHSPPSSGVVGQWRLGEPAFEKPPMDSKGYRYPR
ncbi:hypothetical protein H4R18_005836 [Coemansia javaensis]|uniref:Uncharacterized protein n=1 Tax=Coemansia javaensis TaxID=2761396 RepID=A0A9W8H549_9FUNG|nr:hypothetical protein H4R18_005836 [Coemansia javaensis]